MTPKRRDEAMPSGAKAYARLLDFDPRYHRVRYAAEDLEVPERTIRYWRKLIEQRLESGSTLPPAAIGPARRQQVAETAIGCRPRQQVAEFAKRQQVAARGSTLPDSAPNISGGGPGGGSTADTGLDRGAKAAGQQQTLCGGEAATAPANGSPEAGARSKPPPTNQKAKEREQRARERKLYERPPFDLYGLDDPRIQDAWSRWIQCAKRRSSGPYTETGLKRILTRLGDLGPAKALACIEYSETGGYPGLYFDRDFSAGRGQQNGRIPTGMDAVAAYMARKQQHGDDSRGPRLLG